MPRERLPARRHSETTDLSYCGRRYHLTVGRYLDGRIGEVFICGAKSGSDVDGLCADVGVLVSRLPSVRRYPGVARLGHGQAWGRDNAGVPCRGCGRHAFGGCHAREQEREDLVRGAETHTVSMNSYPRSFMSLRHLDKHQKAQLVRWYLHTPVNGVIGVCSKASVLGLVPSGAAWWLKGMVFGRLRGSTYRIARPVPWF